jgi:Domain of unknown function (DU1801)
MKPNPPFETPDVEAKFASYPALTQTGLLTLRALIFEVAKTTPRIGPLQETLKWSQPAYLTPTTKSGSTIRLGPTNQGGFAIYTHCQTTLIADFQKLFPNDFTYEANRAIHFESGVTLPFEQLRLFISSALTYHLKQ